MDFIRKQVDMLKKPFDKGGKLEKLYPAFNAVSYTHLRANET